MSQRLECIIQYKDAGKVCTDGNECEGGRCLDVGNKSNEKGILLGTCVHNNNCGSYQFIEKGKLGIGITVD